MSTEMRQKAEYGVTAFRAKDRPKATVQHKSNNNHHCIFYKIATHVVLTSISEQMVMSIYFRHSHCQHLGLTTGVTLVR